MLGLTVGKLIDRLSTIVEQNAENAKLPIVIDSYHQYGWPTEIKIVTNIDYHNDMGGGILEKAVLIDGT